MNLNLSVDLTGHIALISVGNLVTVCTSMPWQGDMGNFQRVFGEVKPVITMVHLGALVAAQALRPDIAIQLDLMNAGDTPDMADRGEMALGGGPGMSLYSFHGRGTLNGVIPHPALVHLHRGCGRL